MVSASSNINILSVPNWKLLYSHNSFNKFCTFNKYRKCVGTCPLTMKPCSVLKNFNQDVCGCNFCMYDKAERKCYGQCSNVFLETCVSKVPLPASDDDCTCASCSASLKTTNPYVNNQSIYDNGQQVPTCDASTCYAGNSCSFFYMSLNHRKINETLYCQCNNNNLDNN